MAGREVKPKTGRTELVGPPGRIVVKDEDVARMERKGYVVIEETTLPVNHSEPEPEAPTDDGTDDGTDDSLESKTVKQLRQIAKDVDVSGQGSKAAIIERIKAKAEAEGAVDPAGDDAGTDTGDDSYTADDSDAGADDDDDGTDDAATSGGDSE